ncbi:hypothetical protein M3Y98_01123200 [Aphelenchoides besseyi]|nr:hypothetical protein M3Y98_01123200 [Aphelenchoides besseyi]KAI6210511.1 hypothetical protein M3Y96_00336100 [Aphelenchoides besseyi]
MQSVPLLRVCQVVIVLVQLSALILVSDLCTPFKSAELQSPCLSSEKSKSYDLPIWNTDVEPSNISRVNEVRGREMERPSTMEGNSKHLDFERDVDVGQEANNANEKANKAVARRKRESNNNIEDIDAEETVTLKTFSIERICLPFDLSNVTDLFQKKEWNSLNYVVFYNFIWLLLTAIDLVFALLYLLDSKQVYKNDSSEYSSKMCTFEWIVVSLQIFGHMYIYCAWDELWANEFFAPKYPLGFYVAFFSSICCVLLLVFDVCIVDIRMHLIYVEDFEAENELNPSTVTSSPVATE